MGGYLGIVVAPGEKDVGEGGILLEGGGDCCGLD